MQSLGEILDVYFVSRRTKDFTGAGADRPYSLWIIDELSGYELYVDTMNMLLDGQKVLLDTLYGRVFEKKDNVPIMLLGNSLPYNSNITSFRFRVFEMTFFSPCAPIDPAWHLRCSFYALDTISRYCPTVMV